MRRTWIGTVAAAAMAVAATGYAAAQERQPGQEGAATQQTEKTQRGQAEGQMGLLITAKNLGVSIAVKDLDATSKWYRDFLGFRNSVYREFPDYGTRIQFLEADGVRIELIEDKNWQPSGRGPPPQHTTVQGVSQMTFRVDNIQEVRERVSKLPIEVAWDIIVVEDIGFKEFFIRDNEGNLIQFVEAAYRYAGDK